MAADEASDSQLRITFAEFGGCYRATLARAFFEKVCAQQMRKKAFVVAIREVGDGAEWPQGTSCKIKRPDVRVLKAAHRAGAYIDPTSSASSPFDEVEDVVNSDLLVVMDQYDYDEVLKEVSVLDRIHPGGFYTLRIRPLGMFVPNKEVDIPDPLYASLGGPEEERALARTAKQIELACQYLFSRLMQLQAESIEQGCTWRERLEEELREPHIEHNYPSCPIPKTLVSSGIRENDGMHRLDLYHPVWVERNGYESEQELQYTVAYVGPKKEPLVRRRMRRIHATRYWSCIDNVVTEIVAWKERHNHTSSIMPTFRELRETSDFVLCRAIVAHGGMANVAQHLSLETARKHPKPQGFWRQKGVLFDELLPFVRQGVLPTERELLAADRGDLVGAIRSAGGWCELAREWGLKTRRERTTKRSVSLDEVLQGIRKVAKRHNLPDQIMPRHAQFVAANEKGLYRQIQHVGGCKHVAEQLGWKYIGRGKHTQE